MLRNLGRKGGGEGRKGEQLKNKKGPRAPAVSRRRCNCAKIRNCTAHGRFMVTWTWRLLEKGSLSNLDSLIVCVSSWRCHVFLYTMVSYCDIPHVFCLSPWTQQMSSRPPQGHPGEVSDCSPPCSAIAVSALALGFKISPLLG